MFERFIAFIGGLKRVRFLVKLQSDFHYKYCTISAQKHMWYAVLFVSDFVRYCLVFVLLWGTLKCTTLSTHCRKQKS